VFSIEKEKSRSEGKENLLKRESSILWDLAMYRAGLKDREVMGGGCKDGTQKKGGGVPTARNRRIGAQGKNPFGKKG